MLRDKLLKLAREYYSRKDIQKYLALESQGREVIPYYGEDRFGRRPDTIEYMNDIKTLAEKGATSFHFSEELWKNPLELSTDLSQEQINNLREGWDLILDIDCKFIEYSKITAEMLIEALHFCNVKNIGIKYSGNKGFHIGVSYKAFPLETHKIKVKNFFPEGPRTIAAYLKSLISKKLAEKILEISTLDAISKSYNKTQQELLEKGEFNPFSIIEIDTVLISPRHLLRMPYSLHEKTGFASIVLTYAQLKKFNPAWAKPSRVIPKKFIPEPDENEAKELLLRALDWKAEIDKKKDREEELVVNRKRTMGDMKSDASILKDVSSVMYPPCIQKALAGMKQDGRKRALFVMLNFFKSIGVSNEEIKQKIDAWNKLNYKPLREGYILAQLSWFSKHKAMLPPNCDKGYYKDTAICVPDFLCGKIKNPVNYTKRKHNLENQKNKTGKYKDRKGKTAGKRKDFK